MIRMKAEAVVISKPGVQDHINGANVNMNGKVILADVMDKGYKGAGRLNGEVVLCVAEGDREKKIAETAMNILTKHIPAIKTSGDSFQIEAESFFNHASREISITDGEYSTLSATLVYNFGDCVYIANCGKNAVYTYDEMYLTRIDFGAEEAASDVDNVMPALAFDRIDSITPNTKIIVMSNELYEYTTDEQILSILRGAESVKQAYQNLIDQATTNGANKSVTVLMENLVPVDVPVTGTAAAAAEEAADEPEAAPEQEEAEPELDNTKPSKAPLVVLILLLLLVALIAGLYFGNQYYGFIDKLFGAKESTTETTTEVTESQTEPTASLITISELPSTSASATSAPTTTETTTDRSTSATTTTRRSISSTTERETTRARTTSETTNAPTTEEPVNNTESTEPTADTSTPTSETAAPTSDTSSEPSSEQTPPSSDTPAPSTEQNIIQPVDDPNNELEDDDR